MRHRLLRTGWVLAILVGTGGCVKPRIVGQATLVDEKGAPIPGPAPGVTLNFVNLSGKIEESIVSVQTDAQGKYQSPELPPGKYTVEAALPGFVIETTTVVLKNHGKKKAPFVLKKIRESKGKSVKESEDENIPSPGEVRIKPPH